MKKLLPLLSIIFATSIVPSVWAEPLKLGVILPLTGPYAPVGEDCKHGVIAAEKTVALSGEQIQTFYGDVQAEPKLAVSEFQKMVDSDKIDVALAVRSPIGMAVNALSAQRHIPLLGAVGHSGFVPNNTYAFQFWPSAEQEGPALARLMLKKGAKRVAVLTGEDEWLVSVSDWTVKAIKELGATIVLNETFPPNQTDLQSFASRVRKENADAVFLNLSISQIGVALKRLQEQGVKAQRYSNFWAPKGEVLEAAGSAAQGVSFVETKLNLPNLKQVLQETSGSQAISGMTYSCYAAVVSLRQALALQGPSVTPYSALQSLSEVKTLDGGFPIVGRQAHFELAEKTIIDGKVVEGEVL